MQHASRRQFLSVGLVGAAGAVAVAGGGARAAPAAGSVGDAYPTTDPELARSMVGASHAQVDRVRELLALDVGLAKAAWDWGFGDWETAIGAASHTGRLDIVEVLIGHGARPDLFTFAAMDNVDAVRAIIEGVPGARELEGPHSISLYAHAEAGGAQRVREYLDSVGIAPSTFGAVAQDAAANMLGAYAWGPDESERFLVSWNERLSMLVIERPGGSKRNMAPRSGNVFFPVGARRVSVAFTVEGGQATGLVVEGFGETVRAARVQA
ncbi:MAG TPA: hypothetical protein VFF69_06790 [Phycisphaerales bacterium]|nr:hypothetical protein [Phycisphaerales bacterium]